MKGEPIPTIDLSCTQDDEIAVQLRAACRDVGFFMLVGHGCKEELRRAVYSASAQFFALPTHVKQTVHTSTNTYNRGWTPLGEQTLCPEKQTVGDTKEGFYIGRDIGPDHPLSGTPLHGPNVWPSEDMTPGFRQTMESYLAHMSSVAHRLVRLLALSLDMRADALADKFDEAIVVLRLLHYSEQRSRVDEAGKGVFACGEHTDWGVLTLLSTDDNPGLQIQLKSGEWVDVPPRPDALIVNLGDMLQRWTNGIYRSTPHRVLNVTGRERYSIPFFLEPNFHARIECFPACRMERGGAELFPPDTCGNLLLAKHRATHKDFKDNP
jgi:isopenicillin N synthase-like dioxygenase